MNTNTFFHWSYCLLFSIYAQVVGAELQQPNNSITLSTFLHDMARVDEQETQRMYQEKQQEAKRIEQKIIESTEQIKQEAKQKTKALHRQATKESRSVFNRYAHDIQDINDEASQQAIKLKQEAAHKILDMVADAEKETLAAKHKARKKLLREKLQRFENDKLQTWKDPLQKEFNSHVTFLKNIIVQGESPEEADDFLQHFDRQSTWFDATLAATTKPTDLSFFQLEQKNMQLKNIVDVYQSTESIVQDRIKEISQPLPAFNKIQLLLLYEINAFIQHKGGNGLFTPTLSQEEKNNLVDKVISNALLQSTYKLTQKESLTAQTSQKDKDMLSIAGEPAQDSKESYKEYSGLSRKRPDMIMVKDFSSRQREMFIPKLEQAYKNTLELETIILDTNQKLSHSFDKITTIQQEITDLKTAITDYKKKTSHAISKALLTDDLADRRIQEYKLMLDVKHTRVDESYQQPQPITREQKQDAQEKEYRAALDQELSSRVMVQQQRAVKI